LIAYASVPKANEFEFSQGFALPITVVTVFVPEGVTIQSERATDLGLQAIQDFNFQIYDLGSVKADEILHLSLSGIPREAGSATNTSNQSLLLGVGALGIALVLGGGWMYLRNRGVEGADKREEGDEFESADEVIDAILALDDLHRARKISGAAYQKRRAELKEILKGKM
jgi:hypothetical protein